MLPFVKCCRVQFTTILLCFPLLLFLPLLVSLFICNYASFVLALRSPFPSSHTSIPLSLSICICCSLYVGTCITVPLLVLGQLPHSSVLALVHPPPLSSSSPLLLLILHVCQGPGGSAECTAQWPKREYLRNCQLSPIIRGSP